MTRRSSLAGSMLAAAVIALTAPAARAQDVPIDLELGYRFLDVSGNRDMYRSQIDERQGFLLRSLTLTAADFGGKTLLFDHLRLDATDLGVGPAGGFRLELGRAGLYRLRASYRKTDMFSALPAFANPFLEGDIIPGQHTYDRLRQRFDADIELFPGGAITPIIGYSRNSYSGPGSTTYHVGNDEFRLTQKLSDLDQEVRAGASFQLGSFSGQIVQGWRKLQWDETLTLTPGAGNGNNSGTFLGVPIAATGFQRQTSTDVNTPATSAFVSGRFGPRVRVVASYARARGSSDTDEREDLAGSFVSFEISRFFRGLSEPVASRATATQWNGSGRVEFTLADGLDLEAGYQRRHRELDGFALISSLFLDTLTFSNLDPRDVPRVLEARTSVDRTESVYHATLAARGLGPFAIRGGYSQTDQDLSIAPDPSEIVVPGGQGGDFSRTIKTFDVAATFGAYGITAGADYRHERAGAVIVRTDFRSRDRYRLRAAWGWKELLRVSANAEQIDVENEDAGIALDGRMRQYGGDVDVTPVKPLHLRLSAARYQADNTALIRRPQDFGIQPSVHRENGTSYEGSVGLVLARVEFEAGYGHFRNEGIFPFVVDRIRSHAEVPIRAGFSGVAEWSRDRYSERALDQAHLGNFTANRYGLYLRWHR